MGVQSTRYITRKRAEEIYVNKFLEAQRDMVSRLVKSLNDAEIEGFIEEYFDNYSIVEEGKEDG